VFSVKWGKRRKNFQQARGRPRKTILRLPPAGDGPACDSDRRVTVNNIQVILVCGRPGDRGGCTETPGAASVPRHKCRPGTPGILKYVIRSGSFFRKGIELSNTVS